VRSTVRTGGNRLNTDFTVCSAVYGGRQLPPASQAAEGPLGDIPDQAPHFPRQRTALTRPE